MCPHEGVRERRHYPIPVIKLESALKAWETCEFESVFKEEIRRLDAGLLPLQDCLSHSSHVGVGCISPVVLKILETAEGIEVKTGVFYGGVIAGSCCADDPTPVDEQTEYCELLFVIHKSTAETQVSVV